MSDARDGPLVSVIVPAFNAAETIADTLRSALSQSYSPIELIVVDDGSTDATADVVLRIADPRLKLIRSPNRGQAAARNTAIAAAKGEFIAPLDADDIWHPEKIARQVEAALSAPVRPGFVYCFHFRIDMEGRIVSTPEAWIMSGPVFHRLYYRNVVGTGSAPLFLRAAVEEAGGYERAGNSEDALLQLRVARRRPVACVAERLVGYRLRPGSLTQDADGAFDKWMAVRRGFEVEWPDLPPFLCRWTTGWRWLVQAETLAVQGRYAGAGAAALRALRLDPARTARVVGYRLIRTLARRLRRRRTPPVPPLAFDSAPPFQAYPDDRDAIAFLARRLRRFEERRLERLAGLDEALERPAR